jgi:exo-beta-1,3-glucanase (GH17 family)
MKFFFSQSINILLTMFLILTGMNSVSAENDINVDDETLLKQNKSDLLTGQIKAVAYSGFRTGQYPDRGEGGIFPSDEEILEDLKILTHNSNFNLIRLYDSQKNSEDVLRIIKEKKIDMRVMLGIWLYAEISNHEGCPWLNEPIPQKILIENRIKNREEIENGIRLAKEYNDIIVALNVGNEALVEWNDHMVSEDSVISYVKRVKSSVEQEVTVAENFKWWAENGSALANEVDFISIQTYPLWDGKDIDEGMLFTIETIRQVREILPHNKIVISEAGWATLASEFGERASEEKQKKYYNDLMAWADKMNITTFFFEAFDEDWKGNPDNPLGAEKHWGLFSVDRKAKLVMYKQYPDLVPIFEKK